MEKILILGGTGMLGRPVADHMVKNGMSVRVLTRNPEKAKSLFPDAVEIISGDVRDLKHLTDTLRDCTGIHISVGGSEDLQSVKNVLEMINPEKIRLLTYVSGATVSMEHAWFPMIQQKFLAEKLIEEKGLPYTIFCPTWPMEQLGQFVRDGRASAIGNLPTAYHWFAADDFGRMVAAAYVKKNTLSKRLFIHGPETYTIKQALQMYVEKVHPEISKVSVLPIPLARIIAGLTKNPGLKFAAGLMSYFKVAGEQGDGREAGELLGKPETRLAEWIEQKRLAKVNYSNT